LRSSDFRLFMLGNLISWIGDWMDLAALNWAVLALTGSAIQLGLINACRLIPVFALSLPAGVLADRFDRRRLLIWLQAGTMALTFLVGLLVLVRCPFAVFALVVTLRASLNAMVLPIRNALLPAMVPREAMASAVSIHTAGMNLSRIVGPALAGGLMLLAPIESIFWINGASFIAVLWTLAAVKTGSAPRTSTQGTNSGVRVAIAHIRRDPVIKSLLIMAVVPMVFGFPYSSLMPLFARDLLKLGPAGFGLLLSVSAAGALCGSIWLSLPGRRGRVGRSLVASTLGFGLGLLLFTGAPSFGFAAAAMFLVGFSGQVYRTTSRITLQEHVPDHLRGRILSIALMDRGLIPLGAILIGTVGDLAGAMWGGLLMGGGCIVVTLAVVSTRLQIWRL
jgi:MFS family permease